MHYWGDEWFQKNGNEFSKAIDWCMDNWERWGRIGSHGKEKYGTFRHHPYFYTGWWPIHELLRPGYVAYRGPRWLCRLETEIIQPLVKYSGLVWVIRKYQHYVYNAVVQRALKKWPKFFDELIEDSEFELLKPGIWGPIDGAKIKSKYWVEITPEYLEEERKREEEEAFQEYINNLDAEDYLELYQEAYTANFNKRIDYERYFEQLSILTALRRGDYEDGDIRPLSKRTGAKSGSARSLGIYREEL